MKKLFKGFSLFLSISMLILVFSSCSSSKEASQQDIIDGKKPKKGQTIATITVKDFGEIKIALFEKAAPKGFENFVTHAENGYYDGVTFHRVIDNFMIQGGDPEGTGAGGKSIWGEDFDVEASDNYCHFTGALSYANANGKNSSQFFIVNSQNEYTQEMFKEANDYFKENEIEFSYTDYQSKNYIKYSGTPDLDGQFTVFGQVYEGLDIVGKIMKVEVEVDGESSTPKTPVVIESIKIDKYK